LGKGIASRGFRAAGGPGYILEKAGKHGFCPDFLFFSARSSFGAIFALRGCVGAWHSAPGLRRALSKTEEKSIMSRWFKQTSVVLCVAAATFMGFMAAHATNLTLDVGKTATVQQGSSGTFTFSATNDAGAITNFLGWTLGIQVQPAGTTSGTLSIGSLLLPTSNPILTGTLGSNIDFTAPTLGTLTNSGTINGSTQFTFFGMSANDEARTVNSSASYNLGSVSFNASPNASGTWNVYAVQQQGAIAWKSYWTDDTLTDAPFANPIWQPAPSGNTSVLVGTITAVPEPSSLALLAAAVASAGWFGWKTRRSAKIEGSLIA
jgi:hypothetical protein